MKFKKLKIKDAYTIHTDLKKDNRGYFQRLLCNKILNKNKIKKKIVQINNSFSEKKGTTRGLHFQLRPYAEDKILKCIKGKLINVIVDLRKNSKTFLRVEKVILDSKVQKMTLVPRGCANGIQTLDDKTELIYFVTNYYNPKKERGCRYDDPLLKIKLPLKISNISKKDTLWPNLKF